MHKTRLRQIKKWLLEKPGKFNMETWVNYCGTTCCIGGKGAILAGYARIPRVRDGEENWGDLIPTRLGKRVNEAEKADPIMCWDPMYRKSLRLTIAESHRLFDVEKWPAKFKNAYWEAYEPVDQAKVAAQRIDHFIATGK